MQRPATSLLETIIREELSLLQEQSIGPREKEKINIALAKLFPCLHKQFTQGIGALNPAATNDAVYEKLMSDDKYEDNNWRGDCGESGNVKETVWAQVFPEKSKVQKTDPNWPVNRSAGGNILMWSTIEKDLKIGIHPDFGPYGGKAEFLKAYPAAAQYLPGGLKYKSGKQRAGKSLVYMSAAEQLKHIRQATPIAKKIINARGKGGILADDEESALSAIRSIKNQMQYYWVNQIVCQYMIKQGLNKRTKYCGIPDYLELFSGKSFTDVGMKDALNILGYTSNITIKQLTMEATWWKLIKNILMDLEKENWEHWNESEYFPYGNSNIKALSYHIPNIVQITDNIKQRLGQQAKIKQSQKMSYKPSLFNIADKIDESPESVLEYAQLFALFLPYGLAISSAIGVYRAGAEYTESDLEESVSILIETIVLAGVSKTVDFIFADLAKLNKDSIRKVVRYVLALGKNKKKAEAIAKTLTKQETTAVQRILKDPKKLQNTIVKAGEVISAKQFNQFFKQNIKTLINSAKTDKASFALFYIKKALQAGKIGVTKLAKIAIQLGLFISLSNATTEELDAIWVKYYNELNLDGEITLEINDKAYNSEEAQAAWAELVVNIPKPILEMTDEQLAVAIKAAEAEYKQEYGKDYGDE